jgi:NAD(P)-dependent dehydrogenase (short-subunit alcohol dehydrogenase family)
MTESSSSPAHVVLTGAAGALGRAVAQQFLDAGGRVALLDHHAGKLAETFPGLANSQHLLMACDVTSAQSMQESAAKVLESFQHVDTVVHVAGGFEMGPSVHELERAAWDRMMNLNAWSFVAVSQAFVPAMIQRKGGSLVAVTAGVAARGMAAMSAYIASKSALQRLVEAMAAELKPHGIRVNSIAPSTMDTPANRQAMPDVNPANWVSTAVAAQTVAYLASPAAAALHGQHLLLD